MAILITGGSGIYRPGTFKDPLEKGYDDYPFRCCSPEKGKKEDKQAIFVRGNISDFVRGRKCRPRLEN